MRQRSLAGMITLILFYPLMALGAALDLDTFSKIADQAKPGVVHISTANFEREQENPPVPRSPFRREPPRGFRQRASGSGLIIDAQGLILTNHHVIANVDEITVHLFDGRKYTASVVGTDPETDLALMKIELKPGERLTPLELGDSDEVKVGQWVIAIGNPFGLTHSVTVGVVGAKGRVIGESPYDEFIQTDASINPGNSGGPLLDAYGKVIGINTAILSAGQGIGFAIPINLAKKVSEQLKARGKVVRGWLGITPQAIDRDMARALRLPAPEGVIISSVVKGEPADKAGIRVGDVILSFDGKKISDLHDLFTFVADAEVGSEVELRILRNLQGMTLKAVVGRRPEREAALRPRRGEKALGLQIGEIPEEMKKAQEISGGVIVEDVAKGSLADSADLARGDLILRLNYDEVTSVSRFNQLLERYKKEEVVVLYVKRGDRPFFTTLRLAFP